MTCRRPTISVHLEVLERLARANADADAPDSLEFTPVSWRELDRNSLSDGITDLLIVQADRVRKDEEERIETLRQKAEARAERQAEALRWEKDLMEQKRAERLARRISEARVRAAVEVEDELEHRRALLSSKQKSRAHELTLEAEVVKADVIHSKKRWARTSQAFLAAAALVGVVWVSALGQARTTAGEELAEVWQASKAQEFAAETRVAELEAEIERHVNLSESERVWLENELVEARAALDSSKKEREELDRRRPVEGPSKMARKLEPVVNSKQQGPGSGAPSETLSPASERVATDVVQEGCSSFDPLCFDL